MHPQAKQTNEELESILSAVDEFKRTGRITNFSAVTQLMKDSLQLPVDDPIIDEITTNPFVILAFAEKIIWRSWHEGQTGKDKHDSVAKLLYPWISKAPLVVRVREFPPMQWVRYYRFPFYSDDGFYDFPDNHPILVAKMPGAWAVESIVDISSWISRPELRILSALMFSVFSSHGPSFYFRLHDTFYDLPGNVLLDEAGSFREPVAKRALTAFRIMSSLQLLDSRPLSQPKPEYSHYEFLTDDVYDPDRVLTFYANFDIEDPLSLRTAHLLIKSAALWIEGNRLFGEDATASLFFGLEGCLRLVHRRAFGSSQFEIKPTLAHIEARFPLTPGYGWMLEDAYEKRIQIAHPEPRTGLGWLPNLAADDFYENYGMAIDLFYYAITGDVLPPRD
jgi:hypothetical protein